MNDLKRERLTAIRNSRARQMILREAMLERLKSIRLADAAAEADVEQAEIDFEEAKVALAEAELALLD